MFNLDESSAQNEPNEESFSEISKDLNFPVRLIDEKTKIIEEKSELHNMESNFFNQICSFNL